MDPTKCPHFIFSWIQLLSHKRFMVKIMNMTCAESGYHHLLDSDRIENIDPTNDYQKCRLLYHDMLMCLLRYLDPFWRSPGSPPSVCVLFQGTLRILLVLLHDFPSFLCEYHFSFCQVIPIASFQMRNLVLSAYPKTSTLPDPFKPNLDVHSIEAMDEEPVISPKYKAHLVRQDLIDEYLNDAENHESAPADIAALLKLNDNRKG